jgi:hypothetical protein
VEGDERSIEDMTDREERKHGRKEGMTEAEREERDAELIRDRLRGQSWPYLAEKYGLTQAWCKRIYTGWRPLDARPPGKLDRAAR